MTEKIYHGIQLADGEEIIRDYHAAIQSRPKINIYLAVTTRRLLSAGESKGVGGGSLSMSEVYIQDISGISAFYGSGIDLRSLIAGLVFIIIGAFFFIVPFIGILFGILFLLAGLYSLYYFLKHRGKAAFLEVFSKSGMSTPISLTATTERRPSLISLGLRANYVMPGPDFERLVNELSACVMDLQSDPENAIKKWSTAVSIPTG